MTHAEDVRMYLSANRFLIETESAVLDGLKPYIAFSARYSGQDIQNDDAFWFRFGGYWKKDDAASRAYVKKELNRLADRIRGLRSADPHDPEAAALEALLQDERLRGIL